MKRESIIKKMAIVGSYVPRKGEIAAFTSNLYRSICELYPEIECHAFAISDKPGHYSYFDKIRLEIDEKDILSLHNAADFINFNQFDIVCFQYTCDKFILDKKDPVLSFLKFINTHVITSFHNFSKSNSEHYNKLLNRFSNFSSGIVLISETALSHNNTINQYANVNLIECCFSDYFYHSNPIMLNQELQQYKNNKKTLKYDFNMVQNDTFCFKKEKDSFYETLQRYIDFCELSLKNPVKNPTCPSTVLDSSTYSLPQYCFDHIQNLTDSTGILQHAKYTIPDFNEGYCTDDNSRALIFTILLEKQGIFQLKKLTLRYLAFLYHAFDKKTCQFRNFMSFNRNWLETVGSEDSQGRAVWALGTCAGISNDTSIVQLSSTIIEKALPKLKSFKSPRAWAFSATGIYEYLKRFKNDRLFKSTYKLLIDRIFQLFLKNSTPEWPWCEDIVSYANGKLSEALICGGEWSGSEKMIETGLKSLKWLLDIQITPKGYFRAIGCNGFYRKGNIKALFDQQPLEAYTMICACHAAYRITSDIFWKDSASTCFEWFLGKNDLGISLYDKQSGGCKDAIHSDRVNCNEGAESTLSFLLALSDMYLHTSK